MRLDLDPSWARPPFPAARSLRQGALALGLAAALGASAWAQNASPASFDVDVVPVPICSNVPNGSFQDGFTSWKLDPCTAGFGEGYGFANATVDDLSSIIGCDTNVACLNINTGATWTCDKPSGSGWQAQQTIERKAVVRGRFLRFKVFGGFEFIKFDAATIKYDALVVVEDGDGNQVKCEILSYDAVGELGCPNGVAALGAIPLETMCCDLAGSGITVGETVTIRVVFSAAVIACDDCDDGQFFGSFCVDDFQFCTACLQPATPLEPVVVSATATSLLPSEEFLVLEPRLDGPSAVARRLQRIELATGIDLATGLPLETAERD